MTQIDKYDRKILFELSKDSRQSDQAIGKKINKSKFFVNYRIKRLEKEKVILSYQCRVNWSLLRINAAFRVFFRLKNLTEETQKNIHNYLMKSNNIPLFATYLGVYDLSVVFIERSLSKANQILDNFLITFKDYISDYDVFFRYSDIAYPRKYLTQSTQFEGKPLMEEREKVSLDKNDLNILTHLLKDPKIQFIKLANQTDLNIKTLIGRIKNLKNKGIITSFSIHLDPNKIGYSQHILLVNIDLSNQELKNKLIEFSNSSPNITYLSFNIEKKHHIELYVKDDKELQSVISILRQKFPEIKDLITIKTIEEPKEDFSVITTMI